MFHKLCKVEECLCDLRDVGDRESQLQIAHQVLLLSRPQLHPAGDKGHIEQLTAGEEWRQITYVTRHFSTGKFPLPEMEPILPMDHFHTFVIQHPQPSPSVSVATLIQRLCHVYTKSEDIGNYNKISNVFLSSPKQYCHSPTQALTSHSHIYTHTHQSLNISLLLREDYCRC